MKRDPVKKNMDVLHKPRTFRDRKKNPSKKDEARDHPLHEPYVRPRHKDLLRQEYLADDPEVYDE